MAKALARRRARRPSPPRRPLRATTSTQLAALKITLDQLLADLRLVKAPVDDLCGLIGTVKKPLTLPKTVAGELKDLRTLLQVVNTVASAASWLPAPAGPAAKAVTTGLKVFLGPPAPGALSEMIGLANELDQAFAPVRAAIEKAEKPANKVAVNLAKVEQALVVLADITARLIARHGENPPAAIEACAARLEAALAPIAQAIATLKREVAARVKVLANALRVLVRALEPFSGVVQKLQSALAKLAPLRDALLRLKQALSVVERVRRWGESVVKRVLKSLGLDVNKIERWMDGILQQINPFKPLKQAFAKLVASVKSAVANLPGIDALLKLIDSIQALAERLQAALDDFLGSECGKLFAGGTAR
ncbi:MAG TPA: hypothetical protein VML91_01360 [Burkholderiales bacterium]|nr:hypothetical protein [Burkholderiales bacterium]